MNKPSTRFRFLTISAAMFALSCSGTATTGEQTSTSRDEPAPETTNKRAPAATAKPMLTGRVVDANGRGVEGIRLAPFWGVDGYAGERESGGKIVPVGPSFVTDTDGNFSMIGKDSAGAQASLLLGYDKDQEWGCRAVIDSDVLARGTVELTLMPVVEVCGRFNCTALGRRPFWATNYFYTWTDDGEELIRFGTCIAKEESRFRIKLPPGDYHQYSFGEEVQARYNDFTLSAGQGTFDLGEIDFTPTVLAQHYGERLPLWSVCAARGVAPDVWISDYEGQWIYLIYWAFW